MVVFDKLCRTEWYETESVSMNTFIHQSMVDKRHRLCTTDDKIKAK